MIDTGVARHRLLPRLTAGGDYVATGDGTQDCDGHGTIVAGIIAAVPVDDAPDAFGGIAPDAGIIAIRQSSNEFRRSDGGSGPGVGDVDTLAMAVRTAADLGATVINISSVACVSADGRARRRCTRRGAGLCRRRQERGRRRRGRQRRRCRPVRPAEPDARSRAQPGRPDWDDVTVVVSPSWYDDYVLTVGSVGPDGHPSRFTLAGPWVDVAAPGESVVSLSAEGDGLVDTRRGIG